MEDSEADSSRRDRKLGSVQLGVGSMRTIGGFLVITTATLALGGGVPSIAAARAAGESAYAEEDEGRVPRPAYESQPAVPATFLRDGYRPGQLASLVLWRREPALDVQFFRVGSKHLQRWTHTSMQGEPVTPTRRLRGHPARTRLQFAVGEWPSGVYFLRLQAGGLTGHAPLIVGPRRLGEHKVLVVEPTFTWQAYNYRDDNGDGVADTWYADPRRTSINLARPYLARGVPPYFVMYDLPFLEWLDRTHKQVDVLSDAQYSSLPSALALRRAYKLIIFPGHEEYVTEREYDLTKSYRDLGGHLMFLSANNFFWKVVRRGQTLVRVQQWRKLGRPESALVGVQFIRNDNGQHQAPWVVRNASRFPWLIGDSGLRVGSKFGHGGIEIDHTTRFSPRGTTVVADMRNVMPQHSTAQMTFYTTARGAKVFAAGAFTLAGASDAFSCHILDHLWERLTRQRQTSLPPDPPATGEPKPPIEGEVPR